MPSIIVFGVDRSSSTTLYQTVRDALSFPLAVHETRYSQQLRFAAADPHLNKVLAATARFFVADIAELDAFDHRLVVVRDAADALVSEVLGRLSGLAKTLDDDGYTSLVSEIQAASDPGLVDLDAIARDRADESPAVDAVVADLARCDEVARTYADRCVLLRHEEIVAGDVARLTALLGQSVVPAATFAPHLWHSAALATPGLAARWATERDLASLPTGSDAAAAPAAQLPIDELLHLLYEERRRAAAVPSTFDTLRDREVYTDEYVGHIRAAINDGYEGAMIEFALINLYGYVDANNTQDQYVRWMRAAMRRNNPSAMIHWGIALERLLASDREHRAPYYFGRVADLIGNRAAKRRIEITRELYDANGFPNRER